MEDWLRNQGGAQLLLLLAVGIFVVVVGFLFARNHFAEKRAREADLAAREMATMVEHVEATAGGAICMVLLILTVAFSFFSYAKSTTIFQQIEAGVSLMSGIMLFGLGVALGRKKTYRVYRSYQSTNDL